MNAFTSIHNWQHAKTRKKIMRASMGLMVVFFSATTLLAQYGGIMQGIGPQPRWMHHPVSPGWSSNWSNAAQRHGVQRRMTPQEVRAKRYAQNVQKRYEADLAAQQRLHQEQFERAQKEHMEKMTIDRAYAASYREKLINQQQMREQNIKAAVGILGLLGSAMLSAGEESASPSPARQDLDDLRQYNMNRHRAIQEAARTRSPWNQ